MRPAETGVGCSSDGKWLFIQTITTVSPGLDRHSLLVRSADTGIAVAAPISLPGCGVATFIPWRFGGWDIAVMCNVTNYAHFVSLSGTGDVAARKDVQLIWAPKTAPDGTFVANGQRKTTSMISDPANRKIVFVRAAGGLDQMSVDTLDIQSNVADDWQRDVPAGGVAISPGTGSIFVGSVQYSQKRQNEGLMNGISVLRAADMAAIATIRTALPFASLAISGDGRTLYTVNTLDQSITLIDTATMREIKTIPPTTSVRRPVPIALRPERR